MKILFLHGFFASGQCVPAVALKEALKGKAEVLTPENVLLSVYHLSMRKLIRTSRASYEECHRFSSGR